MYVLLLIYYKLLKSCWPTITLSWPKSK